MVKPKSKAKVVLPKKAVKKKVEEEEEEEEPEAEEVVVKEKPGKTASKKSKAPVTSPVKKAKRSQENNKPGTAPSKERKVSQKVSDESPKDTPKSHKKTPNKEKTRGRPPLAENREMTTPEADEEEEVVKEKPGKTTGKKSKTHVTTPVKKAKRSVQENEKPGPASSKKRKVSQEGSDESPKETPKTHKKTPNKEKARERPPFTENLESNNNTLEAEVVQSSSNTTHRRSTNATGSQNSDTDIATGQKFKKNLKRALNESQIKSVAGLWAICAFRGSDKDTLYVGVKFEDNDLRNEVEVGLEREFWQRGLVDLPLASTLRKIKEFWDEVYIDYKEEHYEFDLTQMKVVQVSFMDFVCNSEGRIKFVTDVKAISDRFLDLLGKFAESLQE